MLFPLTIRRVDTYLSRLSRFGARDTLIALN